MRKLATIAMIEEIQPIEDADKIEKIRIKGWWCVSQKQTFQVNDLCVYFEVDSLLPNIEQFSFLAKGSSLKSTIVDGVDKFGYRLKTVRLRKQISQGLALPIRLFPELGDVQIGDDVSEKLNVYKFELPIPVHLAAEVKGLFPGFLPKSDEERVQNCIGLLEKYKGRRFYITSKIDGTSGTVYKYRGEFGVCGHNLEYKENDKNIFWRLARQYDLANKLPEGYAIQGEVAGEGIQSNRIKLKGQDIYVFYVIKIADFSYLLLDDMLKFVSDLGLKTVPVVNDNFILDHTFEQIIKMADAKSLFNLNEIQEGLVFRLYDSSEKISFKSISNEYLLKFGL